eukprot:Polyplicarium_translucidae@DN2298_c0_g1_i1.p1
MENPTRIFQSIRTCLGIGYIIFTGLDQEEGGMQPTTPPPDGRLHTLKRGMTGIGLELLDPIQKNSQLLQMGSYRSRAPSFTPIPLEPSSPSGASQSCRRWRGDDSPASDGQGSVSGSRHNVAKSSPLPCVSIHAPPR